MNSKVIKLLVSVCISLCAIIAGEWLYASYARHSLLTSISSVKQQDYKTDELPEIDLTQKQEENYDDLVARPLFIKGRKPVEEPTPEAVQAAVRSDSFDWQLTGVYSTKKTVSGLFSRSKTKVAKDNYRKITVGDDLDGWKLVELNKDRAVLKQGGNVKELLLRKPKSKTMSPQGANGAVPVMPAPVPAPPPAPAPVPTDTVEDTTEDTPENNQ